MTVDELRRYGHTEAAIRGVLYARELSPGNLLTAALDRTSEQWALMYAFMGPDTNPTWITSTCAEVAYDRGLIDEAELDRIMS